MIFNIGEKALERAVRNAMNKVAENPSVGNTEGMKPYSEWKHDLFQVIGTAAAIAALTVPLLQWAIDSKIQSVESGIESFKTEIREMDRRSELRQAEAEKRQQQWQEMEEKIIEAKTSK